MPRIDWIAFVVAQVMWAENPCVGLGKPVVLGKPDHFALQGAELQFLSPTAKAVWGHKLTGFDVWTSERVFAVSMSLGRCKLVGDRMLRVEMRIRRARNSSLQTKAYLYLSNGTPNASGLSLAVPASEVWKHELPSAFEKVLRMQIPLEVVNQFIIAHSQAFLEVVVRGDAAVDFVKVHW
jgi:hypothetical protein